MILCRRTSSSEAVTAALGAVAVTAAVAKRLSNAGKVKTPTSTPTEADGGIEWFVVAKGADGRTNGWGRGMGFEVPNESWPRLSVTSAL